MLSQAAEKSAAFVFLRPEAYCGSQVPPGVHRGGRNSESGGSFHVRRNLGFHALALTDTEIRRSKPTDRPYKLSDGGGLHLLITPAGGKLWRWKYRFAGTEKLMALGRYPEIALADARERRDEARKLLAKGTDPMAERKAEKI